MYENSIIIPEIMPWIMLLVASSGIFVWRFLGVVLSSKIKKDGAAEEEGEFEPIENLADMKKEMKEAIEEMKKENPSGDPPLDIQTSSKGLIVNIKGDFAFPSGKADMKPELGDLLDKEIIPRIQASPFQVEVAGHSDSDAMQLNGRNFIKAIGSFLQLEVPLVFVI